ncbi:MAG TPA: ferritin-like domain-containing protein [Ignavibacteria bacterium]|nr:ferritin-like domain-containing protein [Ignavibacteria bacterium]HMR40251.1 ferritin-like domain-containing protein [Ignavibacteria bacterium]
MGKLKTLEDFLLEELKDLYSAENQLTEALPKLEKTATTTELKKAFKSHLTETKKQVKRLDKIGKILGRSLSGKKCKAMEGLIKEGSEIIKENAVPIVKDVALIAAAQKVEHYEIASYGCAATYAELLDMTKISDLLRETLEEEGNADKTLTSIAGSVNAEAVTEKE